MTGKPHALSQSNKEEEDTLPPAAPHKGAEMRILSYPTWETQAQSPEIAGSPSVGRSSQIIGASFWHSRILWSLWLGVWQYLACHDSATVQKLGHISSYVINTWDKTPASYKFARQDLKCVSCGFPGLLFILLVGEEVL